MLKTTLLMLALAVSVHAQVPSITAPPAFNNITSPTTFTWNANSNASQFIFQLLTSLDGGATFNNAIINTQTTAPSYAASFNLPIGTAVAVGVAAFHDNAWYWTQARYTIGTSAGSGGSPLAVFSSPVNGATLQGYPTFFTWAPANSAAWYAVDLGTTAGNNDLGTSGWLPSTVTSNGFYLPSNGAVINARLTTVSVDGSYGHTDIIVHAPAGAANVKASMASPANGATLSGWPLFFTWNPGGNALYYALDLGNAPGLNNIGTSGWLKASTTTNGFYISANGQAIYARLITVFADGSSAYNDYSYTMSGGNMVSKTMLSGTIVDIPDDGTDDFSLTAALGAPVPNARKKALPAARVHNSLASWNTWRYRFDLQLQDENVIGIGEPEADMLATDFPDGWQWLGHTLMAPKPVSGAASFEIVSTFRPGPVLLRRTSVPQKFDTDEEWVIGPSFKPGMNLTELRKQVDGWIDNGLDFLKPLSRHPNLAAKVKEVEPADAFEKQVMQSIADVLADIEASGQN